jgi:hypothetical protein
LCGKQQRRTGSYSSQPCCTTYVSIDLLRESYYSLKKKAASGVEGMRWEEYGADDLEGRLADLHGPSIAGDSGRNRRYEPTS